MSLTKIFTELSSLSNKKRAMQSQRYFKTAPGEYAFGDVFIGVRVPELRQLASKYQAISMADCLILLKSPIHEYRFLALVSLERQYKKANSNQQQKIFNFYLKHTKHINNWDLVDVSAYKIVGVYLLKKNKSVLSQLAKSSSLWERRIAIIATYHFIQHSHYATTLKIAKILLFDEHDLIHKAVGWMLREVGKKDQQCEVDFLEKYAAKMPRTMLRYAIEKMSAQQRKNWLAV